MGTEKFTLEFKHKLDFLNWFTFSKYEEVLFGVYYEKLEIDYKESEDKKFYLECLKNNILWKAAHPPHSSSPGNQICEQMELKAMAKFYEQKRDD